MIAQQKSIKLIGIVLIVLGVIIVISSFPIFNLLVAINRGGSVIKDKTHIVEIVPDSPAAKSQLMPGDYLIALNNQTVISTDQFVKLSQSYKGKEITIKVERNGIQKDIKIISRETSELNQGALGILITDDKFIEESKLTLIPKTIIRSYLGNEIKPAGISLYSLLSSQYKEVIDTTYSRMRELITGLMAILIGMGIIKLRKLALMVFYGFSIMNIINTSIILIRFSYNVQQYSDFNILPVVTLFFLLLCVAVNIFAVGYLYIKRFLFH